MGFELSPKLQELINNVETKINKVLKEQGETPNIINGDLTDEKTANSIFLAKDLVQDAVSNGDITVEDAKTIFGLELSGTTPKNAPRRAAGEGGDGNNSPIVIIVQQGSTLIINIDNSTKWQLTINIDANIKDLVDRLIDAFKENTDFF